MDISHCVGGDIALNLTGGIAQIAGDEWTRQRILRRLLTNSGDYIWDPSFGGNLRKEIGSTVEPGPIAAAIRRQLRLEASIATQPAPTVSVTSLGEGSVNADIIYIDVESGLTRTLAIATGDGG